MKNLAFERLGERYEYKKFYIEFLFLSENLNEIAYLSQYFYSQGVVYILNIADCVYVNVLECTLCTKPYWQDRKKI